MSQTSWQIWFYDNPGWNLGNESRYCWPQAALVSWSHGGFAEFWVITLLGFFSLVFHPSRGIHPWFRRWSWRVRSTIEVLWILWSTFIRRISNSMRPVYPRRWSVEKGFSPLISFLDALTLRIFKPHWSMIMIGWEDESLLMKPSSSSQQLMSYFIAHFFKPAEMPVNCDWSCETHALESNKTNA